MRMREDWWQIAIRSGKTGKIITDRETPFHGVPNPPFQWAADPFLIEDGDKLYIYAELFSITRRRGELGYCVYENGKFSKWTTVMRNEHHLSFPYIFVDNGKVYLMPESGSASEIAVYRLAKFPGKAEKSTVLYNGDKMVDTIMLPGGYFLSYHMDVPGREEGKLTLLKYTDGKLQKTAEAADTDGVLRPGGKAFRMNNMLVRPAQDSRQGYGSALEFLSVEINGGGCPREEKIGVRITPQNIAVLGIHGNIQGIHTYNSTQNYEVIDVRYSKLTIAGLFTRLWQKLKKHRR